MSPKRGRKKVAAASPPPSKPKAVPQWAAAPPHGGRRISWSFSSPDVDGDWSWSNLGEDRLPEILGKLGQFEGFNQQEIKRVRSIVSVSKLAKSARDRLSRIGRDDLDQLVAFHIQGQERLWCAPYDGVMFVLWWDPKHTVYPVPKKHT